MKGDLLVLGGGGGGGEKCDDLGDGSGGEKNARISCHFNSES